MKRFFEAIADYIRETDKLLIILCIACCGYSALLVTSATYISSGLQKGMVQLIGMVLGLTIAIILSLIDYKYFLKYWYIPAGLFLLLVLITFKFGYAPDGTDDKAWLALPFGQSIQPSEFLKIGFIISFTAHVSALSERQIKSLSHVVLLALHGAFPVLLIHFQGDDGSALVLAVIFLGMLFAAGVQLRYFAVAGGLIAISAPLAWLFILNEDQKNRILALLDPQSYASVIYQQARGQTAIGSGGFWGYGLFHGPYVQGGLIPLGYNDFIFASAGEELGFLGCMVIILLLTALCIRVLRNGQHARDKAGMLLCVGVFTMFAAQTVINLGMCLSILPVIGVTLPFFSAGGTSVIALFLGIGLVLSVYKNRNRRAIILGE